MSGGYEQHFRRAEELADRADEAFAKHAQTGGEWSLRRAETLAQMSSARSRLAWLSYMQVDALAAVDLAEYVDQPQPSDVRPIRPGTWPWDRGGAS